MSSAELLTTGLQQPLSNFEQTLVNGDRATTWLLGFRPWDPYSRAVVLKNGSKLGAILEAQHDVKIGTWSLILRRALERRGYVLWPHLPGVEQFIFLAFGHPAMKHVFDRWRFCGIIRHLDPRAAAFLGLWRRGSLKPFNAQPNGSVAITSVERQSGETGELVLVKNELRTVGEPVLREASRRSFIEFHEGFDVIE